MSALAKLRERIAARTAPALENVAQSVHSTSRLAFFGEEEDKSYLPQLKSVTGGASVNVVLSPVELLTQVVAYCAGKQITKVLVTSSKLIARLSGDETATAAKYMGSLFKRDGLEWLVVPPLKWLVTVNYGSFLFRRYLTKLTKPEDWLEASAFSWSMLTPANEDEVFARFQTADIIGIDIETKKDPLRIDCLSYTALWIESSGLRTESVVLDITDTYSVCIMRKFNAELKPAKAFQNGKYDLSYFFAYSAPVYNYLWDTINMSHCWYAELPKDLGFLAPFFVRDAWNWKFMGDSGDRKEYLEYCARDTWGTVNAVAAWILDAPDWAKRNYEMEFPLVFPSHMAEMQGIHCDIPKLREAKQEAEAEIKRMNEELGIMVGVPGFNVNSPVQMKALFKLLGCQDLPSCDEKQIQIAMFRHPLNARILQRVLDIRGLRKLVSTYLVEEKLYKGKVLYALNPHGTDTGRNASKSHHFWTGLQVQNIPQGKSVKQCLVAPEGWRIAECDLEQAESRDTGYISGDETLINNVEHSPDFHSSNASMFFGIPFEEIYDVAKEKVINKALRTLAKPVNHGANYNMGPKVLVATMGLAKIYEAAHLLKLPSFYSAAQIAEYLLNCFHRTYPTLRAVYYTGVIADVETTRLLVGATGWTRYCFGDPRRNKSDLNGYVAHPPQSLNAMVLNKAFLAVFYKIALNPKYAPYIRILAQIHDSILFIFKEGHEYLCQMIADEMQIPVTVTGYDKVTRTFVVPAAIKAGKEGKGAQRWSETE
jgi:DNA polymerase I-like protein with 3'-5' exonuclease and polymerase domains